MTPAAWLPALAWWHGWVLGCWGVARSPIVPTLQRGNASPAALAASARPDP